MRDVYDLCIQNNQWQFIRFRGLISVSASRIQLGSIFFSWRSTAFQQEDDSF